VERVEVCTVQMSTQGHRPAASSLYCANVSPGRTASTPAICTVQMSTQGYRPAASSLHGANIGPGGTASTPTVCTVQMLARGHRFDASSLHRANVSLGAPLRRQQFAPCKCRPGGTASTPVVCTVQMSIGDAVSGTRPTFRQPGELVQFLIAQRILRLIARHSASSGKRW